MNPKRMLAFVNHFVVHTVSFLNRFSVICEEKLEDLSVRLQRLETTVCLLEAKVCVIFAAAAAVAGSSTVKLLINARAFTRTQASDFPASIRGQRYFETQHLSEHWP